MSQFLTMALRVVAVLLMTAAAVCLAGNRPRIVGGQPTTVERYPSIVQVDFFDIGWSQGCGASILTSIYVLSAAHCFLGPVHETRIRAGATYRNVGGHIVPVSRVFNHPSFNLMMSFDGDISVVQLISPLTFSAVIQQAQIVSQGFNIPDNVPVVAAGWGHTESQGSPSPVLLDVTIYTINRDLCRERYLAHTFPGIVTENMICAGILDVGGKDACQKDSGGPLYFNDIVVGITAWGEGCANETYPGVSTAVSSYTDWIVQTAV